MPSEPRIEVVRGDITDLDVDVIVNAANQALRRGSGVCGAIFAAAGPELDAACEALAPCPTGDAVRTPGFAARARWIVHTVGPVWRGGHAGEAALLASCYRRSLEEAAAADATSVAFPAISTGVYGYPPDAAAAVAVTTVARCAAPPIARVLLVAFDAATEARYRDLLAESPLSPPGDPGAGPGAAR